MCMSETEFGERRWYSQAIFRSIFRLLTETGVMGNEGENLGVKANNKYYYEVCLFEKRMTVTVISAILYGYC